eukprot:scaffold5030_cov56-Phaeocystis_antarctica.AAC.3
MSMTSEEARQQAQAEGLMLLVADNKAGYFCVYLRAKPGKPNLYQARVWRGGEGVTLGYFANAEEAALCVARSPEGRAAAGRLATAAPMTSEEARVQAQAEGLTLVVAENATGYFGVRLDRPGRPKPYQAQVKRGGEGARKTVTLGYFATAEEAALHVARSPEGQAAAGGAASVASQGTSPAVPPGASLQEESTIPPEGQAAAQKAAAAPVPLTSQEARQQAQAEGLTLRVAESKTGYFGVKQHSRPGLLRPYEARVSCRGREVHLGTFATADEAALCVARSPEGQAAAARAAAAESLGALPAVPSGAIPQETGTIPAVAPGAVVTVEALLLLLDDDLVDECIGRDGQDNALLVKEEEDPEDVWPKRQRMK